MLVALTVLVCIVALAGSEPIGQGPAPPPPSQEEPQQEPPPGQETPAPVPVVPEFSPPAVDDPATDGDTPDWVRLAGLLLILLAVALLLRELWRWRAAGTRRRRVPRAVVVEEEPEPPPAEPEVALLAVDAALVPLREPADAREAVIEAYARMERVLAERALERRTPEAPREYLERVLREQGMPERSLTTLTALFEEARFSLHPVPDSAPARAREELEQAREALGVGAGR